MSAWKEALARSRPTYISKIQSIIRPAMLHFYKIRIAQDDPWRSTIIKSWQRELNDLLEVMAGAILDNVRFKDRRKATQEAVKQGMAPTLDAKVRGEALKKVSEAYNTTTLREVTDQDRDAFVALVSETAEKTLKSRGW